MQNRLTNAKKQCIMKVKNNMENQRYNQNYTKEQVEAILNVIQTCVRTGNYHIALNENRQENIRLIDNYNLSSKKRKEILLQIKTEDFCHSPKTQN